MATNIAGTLPGLGSWLRKIVVGGPEYGHHTLTRFYALHVGILPPLVIGLIVAHIYVFRRHGVTHGLQHIDLVTIPRDEKGEPIAGATVRQIREITMFGARTGGEEEVGEEVRTDELGRFSVELQGLHATLEARAPGFSAARCCPTSSRLSPWSRPSRWRSRS